jgi:multiple sugar transport system permease protein
MTSNTSDQPVKRYFIHALMLFLGLIAVVPIFVLLINSTRTTEQINTGFTIIPGKDAFFPTTGTVIADWDDNDFPDDESGTAKYFDLVMGQTLKEEVNAKTGVREKRVIKALTESRLPRVVIFNEENQRLGSYNLSNNAVIFVNEGQRVKKGEIIARVIVPPNIIYNWRALTGRGFQIWQGFGNSAFISICATLLSVYFSGLTAYGMHVYRFRGRTAIWLIILIIMMLPGSLTFIGFYQLMALWNLTDTYIPLIFPSIAAAATVLFIRQYMMSVLSLDLIDAARIDGAGEYRIFNTIIIPVIIPALAAQAIFTFVGSWNNYITPSVIISSQSKSTLPMLIFSLRGDIYRTEYGGIYLGIAVSLIPIIVFYSFMSRFIISGITMGGIKE